MYFEKVHPFYPIVVSNEFQTNWIRLYSNERPQISSIDYSRFLLIVVIGVLSESRTFELDTRVRGLCRTLYEQSWAMVNEVIAVPFTGSVQVLLLHVRIMWVLLVMLFYAKICRLSIIYKWAKEALHGFSVELQSGLHSLLVSIDAVLAI